MGFRLDVPQDYVQAHMWYDIAGVAVAVSYRDYVAREMTTAQVAEAQRLAREWLGKHPYAGKGLAIVLQTPILR